MLYAYLAGSQKTLPNLTRKLRANDLLLYKNLLGSSETILFLHCVSIFEKLTFQISF